MEREQLLLERKTGKRARTYLLWPMRLVVYGGTFVFVAFLLAPRLTSYIAILIGGLLAASSIVLETWLTAHLRARKTREVGIWRLLFIDKLLSRPGEAYVDQKPQHLGRQSERPVLKEGSEL